MVFLIAELRINFDAGQLPEIGIVVGYGERRFGGLSIKAHCIGRAGASSIR